MFPYLKKGWSPAMPFNCYPPSQLWQSKVSLRHFEGMKYEIHIWQHALLTTCFTGYQGGHGDSVVCLTCLIQITNPAMATPMLCTRSPITWSTAPCKLIFFDFPPAANFIKLCKHWFDAANLAKLCNCAFQQQAGEVICCGSESVVSAYLIHSAHFSEYTLDDKTSWTT